MNRMHVRRMVFTAMDTSTTVSSWASVPGRTGDMNTVGAVTASMADMAAPIAGTVAGTDEARVAGTVADAAVTEDMETVVIATSSKGVAAHASTRAAFSC